MQGDQPDVLLSSHSLPADSKSYTTAHIRMPNHEVGAVELRIKGIGSFDPHIVRRETTVFIKDGNATTHIFAPNRPGTGTLIGPGFQKRISFVAATWMQDVLYGWLPTIGLALFFALILRTFAFASFYIPSGSMRNTMEIRDVFLTDNFSYQVMHQEPQRGDILVFRHPDTHEVLIKRVIGLPGEKLEVIDGYVFINGQSIEEDYIKELPVRDFDAVIIPAGNYFMMGDNRNNSRDSRYWGFLPKENIIGRAAVIVWPPSRIRTLDHEHYFNLDP